MVPGLSQYELAELLGVSRSLVYFAELGLRELPAEADQYLKAIQTQVASWNKSGKADKRLMDDQKVQVKEAISYATDKIEDCRYKAQGLKRKLKRDREVYDKHVSAMAVNSIIAESVKKGRASVREAEWLKNHDVGLGERLVKNNPVAHALIQLQIDLLSAQQKVYEQFVTDNK